MKDSLLSLEKAQQHRAILRPVTSYPRTKSIHIVGHVSSLKLPPSIKTASIVAIDFETRGSDFTDPSFFTVGIGISYDAGSWYVPLDNCTAEQKRTFLTWISKLPIIGHNIVFDAGVLYKETGLWGNWKYCTFGLYKQLSNEGFEGQQWGLKAAQKDVLGWKNTNETQLNKWLVENGYHKSDLRLSKPEKGSYYYNEKIQRWARPEKSEMWRAPAHILGHYCALDADATWQLYTKVLYPAIKSLPYTFQLYHQRYFLASTRILVEQQESGITIDKAGLNKHLSYLAREINRAKEDFFSHPEVKESILRFNYCHHYVDSRNGPTKYKKVKERKEPQQKYKKDGTYTKTYTDYLAWKASPPEPEISKNYKNWKKKNERKQREGYFNINSIQHLGWLYYTQLNKEVIVRTTHNTPAVDNSALLGFGDSGRILLRYKANIKEYQLVEACYNLLRQDKQGNWRLHPQFKNPGTLTGRLAGGGKINVQQIPKSVGYLEQWKPVEGKVWIDCDYSALEPTVLTEITRDEAFMQIYGPNAKPNDVYIFFGSQVPGMKEKFLAEGYHPAHPTKESIARIKKKYKAERNACKTCHLGKQYGAGAVKLHQSLVVQGFDISYEEAYIISKAWDETFKGIRILHRELEKEWKDNNSGWVVNGIGRPICVDERVIKDLVNRVCQSTGHDIHLIYLFMLERRLKQQQLPYKWVISDFHDQFIIEVNEGDEHKMLEIIDETLEELNHELQGIIPIKGDPQIIRNMAEAKCESDAIQKWEAERDNRQQDKNKNKKCSTEDLDVERNKTGCEKAG